MDGLRTTLVGLAGLILALTLASRAHAGACQTEMGKFCKGSTNVAACLREHESDLSDECKAYLSFFENMPSCLADARHLCPSKKPSGAGVIKCLRGHQSDLSDACKNEIRKMR